MPVNPNKWVIKDTLLNLYCISYNVILNNCGWGNATSAVEFETQEEAESAIDQWQLGSQTRYVGDRPPKPPQNP